ncbi:hypothetical protein Avbf_02159 [Armadillidium vulgare]|nr:hypothetical protein Avbf_02159 [Armadillidium vulgare]
MHNTFSHSFIGRSHSNILRIDIRNNVSKNSDVSDSRSENINKRKRKRGRPPKFGVESHCSSKSIKNIKRNRGRPPKLDAGSHCSSKSISPPKFDKESHCSSKSINKIKRKHCSPPKFDELGHCSSKSTNKIKRKRSRPPKFDDEEKPPIIEEDSDDEEEFEGFEVSDKSNEKAQQLTQFLMNMSTSIHPQWKVTKDTKLLILVRLVFSWGTRIGIVRKTTIFRPSLHLSIDQIPAMMNQIKRHVLQVNPNCRVYFLYQLSKISTSLINQTDTSMGKDYVIFLEDHIDFNPERMRRYSLQLNSELIPDGLHGNQAYSKFLNKLSITQ